MNSLLSSFLPHRAPLGMWLWNRGRWQTRQSETPPASVRFWTIFPTYARKNPHILSSIRKLVISHYIWTWALLCLVNHFAYHYLIPRRVICLPLWRDTANDSDGFSLIHSQAREHGHTVVLARGTWLDLGLKERVPKTQCYSIKICDEYFSTV